MHLNQNHNTCIDLRADTESELDAAAVIIPDKKVNIARSIRCNTLNAAICYRCKAGTEADRFPNIFHSIYAYLLQQFLNHINNII